MNREQAIEWLYEGLGSYTSDKMKLCIIKALYNLEDKDEPPAPPEPPGDYVEHKNREWAEVSPDGSVA